MTVTPTYPGVYIREIPSGSRTITGVATSITAFVGTAARGPVDEPVPISGFGQFERVFGGLWRESGLGYAVRDFFTNGGSDALVVRVVHATDDPDDAADQVAATATLTVDTLALRAASPGEWGNALTAAITIPTDAVATTVASAQGVPKEQLFNLVVTEGTGSDAPSETFLNVTVTDGPRRLDLVLASSAFVDVSGALPATRPGAGTATGTGGANGSAVTEGDLRGSQGTKTGMYALLKADLFNLLCIPPPTLAGKVPDALWKDAAQLCLDRRAFLVVDPPADLIVSTVDDWPAGVGLTGELTRNAALYFPRVQASDPLRGSAISTFAACGAIAGAFARTDGARGVWKAPAGIEAALSGVVGLPIPLTDDENGALNPLGINCLRTFRGIGTTIWGSRTLRGADVLSDEYKYIPVRRLALFLEETLFRNTQWVVFEPNDEPLWAQIRLSINAFMQDLFRRGAFQGLTPKDAYFVRCDRDTTTQFDIDRGIVNIIVGFAPLKPAEFVVIGIQQIAASATA